MINVFRAEADALLAGLRDLPDPAWDAPTRCTPWRVRDVVGHLIVTVDRVPAMVAADAPLIGDTDAAGYYRADRRFSDEVNEIRVRAGRERAATAAPATLIGELSGVCRAVVTVCEPEPADRLVRTRHGDAMPLSDFLLTRVVELALHGLDIADAVRCPQWLTAAATGELLRLLYVGDTAGHDGPTLLRAATGRAPRLRGLAFG